MLIKYSFMKYIREQAPYLEETPDGWIPIIKEMFEELKKLNPPKDFQILQIKEKFGGLRVYTSSYTDEIEKIIEEAEEKASKTCQSCGKPNASLTNLYGWYTTLCPDCEKDRDNAIRS